VSISLRVERGEVYWSALKKVGQQEMGEVIRLQLQTAELGHAEAQNFLGPITQFGQGGTFKQGISEAVRLYQKTAN
jgi:TPR repeat protein